MLMQDVLRTEIVVNSAVDIVMHSEYASYG